MKPYALRNLDDQKRIFGYFTYSTCLVNRFRVFIPKTLFKPEKAAIITLETIVLPNMLREKSRGFYAPDGFLDSDNENGNIINGSRQSYSRINSKVSINKSKNNHPSKYAQMIRDTLGDHFIGEGRIPWQWKIPF